MNRKTWTTIALILLAAAAIYAFTIQRDVPPAAAAVTSPRTPARPAAARQNARALPTGAPGVSTLHTEWLDGQTGSYRSERNLFSYKEPPPPPPPPPPAPPPPPPDRDKDGIPDFRDNCPDKYNPDQTDIDRNGVGDACQEGTITPPPPPPPVPPQFNFKYIGTFGPPSNPIATFSREGEIVNARVGDTFDGKFILRGIGIESAEIGYVGFPPEVTTRVAIGQ